MTKETYQRINETKQKVERRNKPKNCMKLGELVAFVCVFALNVTSRYERMARSSGFRFIILVFVNRSFFFFVNLFVF